GPIGLHDVNPEGAVAAGAERDELAVGREGRPLVQSHRAGQGPPILTVDPAREDLLRASLPVGECDPRSVWRERRRAEPEEAWCRWNLAEDCPLRITNDEADAQRGSRLEVRVALAVGGPGWLELRGDGVGVQRLDLAGRHVQ